METKRKLENFASLAFKNGFFNIIHRRGYKTTAKFNDEDYTFYIAKGKKGTEIVSENPKWYYTYEASTGMRVCGLGSDNIASAYGYLFNDSFVKQFTELIKSGKLKELQDRFQKVLEMERNEENDV